MTQGTHRMEQLREHARLMDNGVGASVPTCESERLEWCHPSLCFFIVIVLYACSCTCMNCMTYIYNVSDLCMVSLIRHWYLFFAVITCGHLDPPHNGRVSTNAGTFGDVARYFCNEGYVFVPTETCQADGQWSWTVPTCESE